ncbi:hypothetical protein AAHA92_18173 [Salvia divinorum]|uniref:N-acetyltransferase domain-containing protein n=1 Tax=Salvia divinorum TaxID=28513 RepID=A0ABD1H185_SALDI
MGAAESQTLKASAMGRTMPRPMHRPSLQPRRIILLSPATAPEMTEGGLSSEALVALIFDILRVHQLRVICCLHAHGMLRNWDQVEEGRSRKRKFSRLQRVPAQVHQLTRYVRVEEQVAMFLGVLAHHKKNRVVGFEMEMVSGLFRVLPEMRGCSVMQLLVHTVLKYQKVNTIYATTDTQTAMASLPLTKVFDTILKNGDLQP